MIWHVSCMFVFFTVINAVNGKTGELINSIKYRLHQVRGRDNDIVETLQFSMNFEYENLHNT